MTIPLERTRAVNHTREFLYVLIDPKKTPRIPKSVRAQAHHLLRHYPTDYEMKKISKREMQQEEWHRVFGENEFHPV